MNAKWFWLSLALVCACSFIAVAARYEREDLDVEYCMDVAHGSYNYSSMTCDTESNHPYVAYSARHPYDSLWALISGLAAAGFIAGYKRSSRTSKATVFSAHKC